MSGRAHERIGRIFAEACRRAPAERVAYLDDACRGEPQLREEVEALLAADAASAPALDAALSEGGARFLARALAASGEVEPRSAASQPARVGRYRVVRVIGEGGMGIVYEAEQDDPRRRVALKVVRPSMVTRGLLRRFRHEAQVLGQLQHPGIAQIYEAGTADTGEGGQPFFAMELVAGESLLEYAAARSLGTRERLALVALVCDALHHAHQKGVIHRDLKPANVLVTAAGQPKILDFGVARATDSDLQTVTVQTDAGQLVGTVPYMSPEQTSGDPAAIDIRSDVYAAGVLAYELLTGRLPYDVRGKLIHEAVRVIREEEPSRLSSIDRSLRGDVETILAKALEKDKDRRYQSAVELAADIRRQLADEPIVARPASALYLLRKFARRNKAIVGGAAATLVVSTAGAIVAARYAVVAGARAAQLGRTSYVAGMAAAVSALEQHDYVTAAGYLDQTPAVHRGWEYEHLRARLTQHLSASDAPAPFTGPPVFGPQGRRMFGAMEGGLIGEWDAASGELKRFWAIKGADATRPVVLHGPTLRFAATMEDGRVVVGDLATGAITEDLPVDGDDSPLVHGWDASGRQLLYRTSVTRIWDGSTSRVVTDSVGHATLSASGDRIACGRQAIDLFDAASGERLAREVVEEYATAFAFSPNGATLAVGGHYRSVLLLDAETLELRGRLTGHQGRISGLVWTADGSRLVSASDDRTARVWDPSSGACLQVCATGGRDVSVAIAPGSDEIVSAGAGLRRFRTSDPTVLRGHDSFVYYVEFSPDGTLVASTGLRDPLIHVWDAVAARPRATFRAPESGGYARSEFDMAPAVAFSDDGRRVVAATSRETVSWDLASGAALPASPEPDPAARFYETLGRRRDVRLTAHTAFGPRGRTAREIIGDGELPIAISCVISRDGSRAALCLASGAVLVYDQGGREPAGVLEGHVGAVYCAAFSRDGSRIATGGNDWTIRIWDAGTFEQLLVLRGHEQYVKGLAFSPDGTILVSASGDFTVRLWDTVPRHERERQAAARRAP